MDQRFPLAFGDLEKPAILFSLEARGSATRPLVAEGIQTGDSQKLDPHQAEILDRHCRRRTQAKVRATTTSAATIRCIDGFQDLEPWQRDIYDRIMRGERLVVSMPRNRNAGLRRLLEKIWEEQGYTIIRAGERGRITGVSPKFEWRDELAPPD